MKSLFIPKEYRSILDQPTTESAVKLIKDTFQSELAKQLGLLRTTAPMIVRSGTGINDELNGVEKPVSFDVKDMLNQKAEIVQSLAKWKRVRLAEINGTKDTGIYTDMNALRPDEELSNIHSIYVDQWDWEKVICEENRNLEFLKETVGKIYTAMKSTEKEICSKYPEIQPLLSDSITFIHTEELQEKYSDKTPKEREDLITKKYGSVFLIGIGSKLKDDMPHDNRAPDYDDWITPTVNGFRGLNGDILVWNPILESAMEISSMGIRVNKASLDKQLYLKGMESKKGLLYHRLLLNDKLPKTIGGGIGQSRLCMLYLRKAHIGEVQASIWPDHMYRKCKENYIPLI